MHASIHPPGQTHPPGLWSDPPGQTADGTYPTGMHPCDQLFFALFDVVQTSA